MPLESPVGIDHEQVGADANFVGPSALGQDVSRGGMVVKVGEGPVGLPYVALDVVVQPRGGSGEGPKVRIGHLVRGGGAQVVDPFGVEDGAEEDDAVLLEGAHLFFADGVRFGRRDPRGYAVGKGQLRIL